MEEGVNYNTANNGARYPLPHVALGCVTTFYSGKEGKHFQQGKECGVQRESLILDLQLPALSNPFLHVW